METELECVLRLEMLPKYFLSINKRQLFGSNPQALVISKINKNFTYYGLKTN